MEHGGVNVRIFVPAAFEERLLKTTITSAYEDFRFLSKAVPLTVQGPFQ